MQDDRTTRGEDDEETAPTVHDDVRGVQGAGEGNQAAGGGHIIVENCPFGCTDDYSPIVESEPPWSKGRPDENAWRVCCSNGCSGPVSYTSRDDAIARWNRVAQMRKALNLVLLFHSDSHWAAEKVAAWHAVVGKQGATTRILCEHIRKVLS